MPTITPTDLRTKRQASALHLSIFQPATLLTAQVNNGSIARGARSIAFDNGSGSGYSTIAANMLLEVDTNDGTEWVTVRSITGSQSSGTITVRENGINWGDNDVIRIKHFYPLVPIPPTIRSRIFYKDYNTSYTNQNSQPNPVAIIGSHLVGRLSAGSVAFSLNSSSSYAVANGASISSRVWSCVHNGGGTSGISFSSTTTANPTLTITTADSYWLTCTVTDSNGKTQATHRAIFVYDNSNLPFDDFNINGLTGDWQSGGWRFNIAAFGQDVTLADFPDMTLVILWYDNTFNGVTGYIDLWGTAGQNIICTGYLRKDNDNDRWNDGTNDISFEVTTPDSVIDNMSLLGTISLNAVASPRYWYQYASWLTVGRGIHHLLKWHSTVLETCDVLGLTDNTLKVKNIDFTEPTVYQMANTLSWQRGILSKLVSSRLGRLYLVADSQLLNDSERAALDTVFTISEADISGVVDLVRQPEDSVATGDLDGFSFDGSTSTPFISIIPGYRENSISFGMPEFRGGGVSSTKNQVLNNQTDANRKLGRIFAAANRNPLELRFTTPANYLGAFDIVPSIGWYQWGIANDDLSRGTSLNGVNFICRNVSHQIDTQTGVIQTSVVLEPEAQGPDAIQGNYPTSYPARKVPNPKWPNGCSGGWVISPATQLSANNMDVLALADNGSAFCVAAYRDTSDGDGKVVAVQMSSTPVVGTAVQFSASSAAAPTISPNPDDVTESIVAWSVGLTSQKIAAMVTRTDMDLAIGSTASFGTAGNSQALSGVVMLSDTQAFAVLRDITTSRAVGIVLDISGTTITPGTPANIGGATIVQAPIMCRLDSTRVLVAMATSAPAWSFAVVTVSGSSFSTGTGSSVSPFSGNGVMHLIDTDLVLYAENNRYVFIATSTSTVSSVTSVSRTSTTNPPSGLMIFDPALFIEAYNATTNVVLVASQATTNTVTAQASAYLNIDPDNSQLPVAVANSDVIGSVGQVDDNDKGQIVRVRLNC